MILATCVGSSRAQTIPPGKAQPDSGGHAESNRTADDDGFWPTREVLSLIIAQSAEQSCRRRQVAPEVCSQVSQRAADVWSELIEENRETLKPLLDDYLDIRLGSKPVSPDRVKRWAEQAEPVIDQLISDRRKRLDDRASAPTTETDRATVDMIEVGLNVAKTHVAQWKRGEFDEETFAPAPTGSRDRSGTVTEPDGIAIDAPGAPKPDTPSSLRLDPIARELFGWARYVEQFADRYKLDAAQRDAATSCLVEMTERANAHRERHLDDTRKLERRIADVAKNPTAKEEIQREIIRLYGPVDDMFAELKRRLDQIPTTAQRNQSKQSDQSEPRP